MSDPRLDAFLKSMAETTIPWSREAIEMAYQIADAVDPLRQPIPEGDATEGRKIMRRIAVGTEAACTGCDGHGWYSYKIGHEDGELCPRCEAKTLKLGGLFTDPDLNVKWCKQHEETTTSPYCSIGWEQHHSESWDAPTCSFEQRVLVGGDPT